MSKINKLGKSTFVIAILSFLLVAVLAFGGTYAYFSDAANAATTAVEMGTLRFTGNATATTTITAETKAVPNQVVLSAVGATVDSTISYFARVKVTVSEITLADAANHTSCSCADKEFDLLETSALDSGSTWELHNGYYYNKTAYTKDQEVNLPVTIKINEEIGTGSSEHFMGATVSVDVVVEIIQADYIIGDGSATAANATAAQLETAFTNAQIGDAPAVA